MRRKPVKHDGEGRLRANQRSLSPRGALTLALVAALPPLGLIVMWYKGVFRLRGRVWLTALCAIAMAAALVRLTPESNNGALAAPMPVPAPPVSVTAPPETECVNALSNIDALICQN